MKKNEEGFDADNTVGKYFLPQISFSEAENGRVESFFLKNIGAFPYSYEQFSQFYNQTKDMFFEHISVQLCEWFGANMSAVLGAILDKLSTNSITITSDNSKIIEILRKNTFLANYGYPVFPDKNHTTVRYLKLKASDSRYFGDYVMNELLSKQDFPNMSEGLKQKIFESIYEIFVNAQMHSRTEFIYTCGQFFPNKNEIEFTIVDSGIGFKKKIVEQFGIPVNSIQAIRWALVNGNTTKQDAPGGIGLAVLTDFIKMNKGKFQIVSDDGFYEVGETVSSQILHYPFPGTVVNMKFRTDDPNSYRLDSENDDFDIF